MEASSPYAAAKFGSNSFARSKKGMAFNCCPDPNSSAPWVYAFRAPRDEVVTSSTGLSNFWIEARDSPSFSRSREAAELMRAEPFLSRRRNLLASQCVAAAAVHRLKRHYV